MGNWIISSHHAKNCNKYSIIIKGDNMHEAKKNSISDILSSFKLTKRNSLPVDNRHSLDLVSIAFNNVIVIQQQIRLIKKYLTQPYFFTVADNSTDKNVRNSLKQLCSENQVTYFQLPQNPYAAVNGSDSQAFAMNWVYKHYLSPRKADYFGYIDHDIFPFRPAQIIEIIDKQIVYGHIQPRDEKWYLWAGFCFFNRRLLRDIMLDFSPGNGMDTGGSNWFTLYKLINREDLIIPDHSYGHLRPGECPQSDWYEIIGDWIHTYNASEWMKTKPKMDLVQNLLNQY
jgi:hypothetical protein